MLSNIFLHEVLDTWFANVVKPRLKGRAFMIRYADDFDSLPPPFPLALRLLLRRVKRLWHKWLNRRSRQRGSMKWERFGILLREHLPLPLPRVVHSIYAAKV